MGLLKSELGSLLNSFAALVEKAADFATDLFFFFN